MSLYQRLGGQEPLYQLVGTVYDLMKADSNLGKHFKPEFDFDKLTLRTCQFLEDRWGGPAFPGAICGSPLDKTNWAGLLFQAHARVGVTDKEYTQMIGMYEKTMKKMGISKALIQEAIKDLERLREPIVDEKRKFRNKWMKSFQISSADEDAWKKEAEAMQKKEQERKEKLAAFRREKKKQEKEEQLKKEQLKKEQKQKKAQKEAQTKQLQEAKQEANEVQEAKDVQTPIDPSLAMSLQLKVLEQQLVDVAARNCQSVIVSL